MGDVLTPAQRRYCMSCIRGRDTKPEVRLRKALWALGLRYRLTSTLPGKPDLVFRSARTVVFVDGCFWHRCPRHCVPPRHNGLFWQQKLDSNVKRDRRINRKLRRLGWTVVRVWEHEVERNAPKVVSQLHFSIRRRRERSA